MTTWEASENYKSEVCKCGHTRAQHVGVALGGYCAERVHDELVSPEGMECPCPRFTWDANNEVNKRLLSMKGTIK